MVFLRTQFTTIRFSALLLSTSLLGLIGLSACDQSGSTSPGEVQGQDVLAHPPIVIPSSDDASVDPTEQSPPGPSVSPTPNPTVSPDPVPSPSPTTVGTACHGDNTQTFCVGLKYVVYSDSKQKPVVSEAEAISNLSTMNTIWSKCKISFQIDQYLPLDPTQHGLKFNTANDSELDQIRRKFDDGSHFLVVTTGSWNRSGSLGNTGANAWAAMPGDTIAGVILESPVGKYPNIIAHELGHYMNLDHAGDSTNLMSPIIYDTSTSLTTGQCSEAKNALKAYWKAMLR